MRAERAKCEPHTGHATSAPASLDTFERIESGSSTMRSMKHLGAERSGDQAAREAAREAVTDDGFERIESGSSITG